MKKLIVLLTIALSMNVMAAEEVLPGPPYRTDPKPANGDSYAVAYSTGEYVRYDKNGNRIEHCTQKELLYTCQNVNGQVRRFKVVTLQKAQ